MKTANSANPDTSLWMWIAEWWQAKNRRRAAVAEVDNLDSAVASGIARDLGASVDELRALAGKWPDASPELLTRRLQAFDLNAADITRTQPAAARDLAARCSLCSSQTRCRHDLDRDPDDSAWRKYCVNTVTLGALKDEHNSQNKDGNA